MMKTERVSHSIKINLDELRKAKSAAATERKTLGQWLEEAIEEKLITLKPKTGARIEGALGENIPKISRLHHLPPTEQRLQGKEVPVPYDQQKVNIDNIDRGIIVELERDARKSDVRIARNLGLNEASVRKRISSLITAGVIHPTAVTSPWRVGYVVDARIGVRANVSVIEETWRQLVAMPRVRFVGLTIGRYDIIISTTFRSSHELSEFIHKDLSSVTGILQADTFITLATKKRRHDYLPSHDHKAVTDPKYYNGSVSQDPLTSSIPSSYDERAHAIIVELQRNARQSDVAIARKLGLSEATVRRRIKRLVEDRVISIAAVIQPMRVGLDTPVHIGIQVNLSMISDVLERLSAMSRVHVVVLTAGLYDIIVFATFHTPWELSEFITSELSSIPGIIRTETMINLDIKKLELGILPP